MPHLEPTYLRYIYDGLIKGGIHPENAAELPDGLIGMYEEAFDERISVVERQKLLKRFAIWALLKKEVSAGFVAEVLGEKEDDIQEFISSYSSWFNSPESGKYQLYHERLKVYLLQKLSEGEVHLMHEKLITRLERAIEEQKADEFEWYGLEFLGYHLSLHFHLNRNQGLIEKIKNLVVNGFIERQISCSGRYNWTFDFYHQAIAAFELCDDRFKYDYYYQLLKCQLEEENRVEQIIRDIEKFPIEIIIESIENLGKESLFEKQQQFTAYFNAIFNLLGANNKDIDKLTVVNSKLEHCTIELINESKYNNISFFPYPLALLLGAKLSSLKFDIDYLFEHHEIYRYIYGTITQFNEKHVFKYLKLNPKDYFEFIDKLSSKIEKTLESNGKKVILEEESYDPDLRVSLYWDLKIKQLDSLLYSNYELKYYNEFYYLLNKLNTNEIEKYLLCFPSNLDGTLAKNLYRKLEAQRQFKGCYLAIQHFEELNSEDELASIDLILSENIFSSEAMWFLLLNTLNIDPNKLNSYFDSYVGFVSKNRFDYNVLDELFSNCFQLYASNRFNDIKKVNELLINEKDVTEDDSLPYSTSLYLLRFFENHGGVEHLNFKEIIDLKTFDLSFLADNDKQIICQNIFNINLEIERELYLKNRDSFGDPDDYYASFELSVCEFAIKLGLNDLVVQMIPKIHIECRIELLMTFDNSKIDGELAKNIDAVICLDERKYGLDSDVSAEKLKLRLLTKTLYLGLEQCLEPVNLFDKKVNKVEVSSFNQENYILNFGKAHLENQEIQRAINILPYLMNFKIPSLSFEIAFTILKMNRNWEEFNSISNDLLDFYEDRHDQVYGSFNLQPVLKTKEIETILRIASEIKIDASVVINTLKSLFDLKKLPHDISLFEISNFKSVTRDFLKNIMIELIINSQVKRNPIEQLYLLTKLPWNEPSKKNTVSIIKNLFSSLEPPTDNIEDLFKLYEIADDLNEFYPTATEDYLIPIAQSRENVLEELLLLGLLTQTPMLRIIMNTILQRIPSYEVINETDGKALSYFLQLKTKLKDLSIVPILENIAHNHKLSIYTFWDEDEGMFVEFPHVKNIIGKSTLVRNEAVQFKSENYTENGIWYSDNEHVAIVDDKGLVTAIGIGKATIILTVHGIYSSISNSNYKTIEVIEHEVTETVAEGLIQNELGKPVDQINFSPILYKTMKDKKKFRKMMEQHAVYKSYFPEMEENYLELAHELFDLSWMKFSQETI